MKEFSAKYWYKSGLLTYFQITVVIFKAESFYIQYIDDNDTFRMLLVYRRMFNITTVKKQFYYVIWTTDISQHQENTDILAYLASLTARK